MKCLDKLASYLFYVMIIDFSLEILDFIELSQNPIPLGDIQFDITQSLESYNVELE